MQGPAGNDGADGATGATGPQGAWAQQVQLAHRDQQAPETASEILAKIKTVDGSGSGLDADTVDGLDSTQFLRSDATDTMTGSLTVTGAVDATSGYQVNGTTVINSSTVGSLSQLNVINSSTPTINIYDNGNGSGGGASGKIIFQNTDGDAIGIGYTGDSTADSDLIISTNAGGTYGGYLGLDAGDSRYQSRHHP